MLRPLALVTAARMDREIDTFGDTQFAAVGISKYLHDLLRVVGSNAGHSDKNAKFYVLHLNRGVVNLHGDQGINCHCQYADGQHIQDEVAI